MAWNPQNLQNYEDEMRAKRQAEHDAAHLENVEHDWRLAKDEVQRLQAINAELLAACKKVLVAIQQLKLVIANAERTS